MMTERLLAILASIAVVVDFLLVHGPRLITWGANAMAPERQRLYNISVNALLILALVLSAFSFFRSNQTSPSQFPANYKLTEVKGRKFANERVPLDGYRYVDCEMTNVTLVWNGTAPFAGEHVTVNGFTFYTDSDAVMGTVMLLKQTHSLVGNFEILTGPERKPMNFGSSTP